MTHPILVPPLGQTTDTVMLSAWYKQPGQPVQAGEPLFAIETDKATLDIEAQDTGILAQVSAQAGDEVKALSQIGMIAAPGEQWSPGSVSPETKSTGVGVGESGRVGNNTRTQLQPIAQSQEREAVLRESSVRESPYHERTFVSPRARKLAEAEQLDWRLVKGTGPEGAIVERDVREFLARVVPAQAATRGTAQPSAPMAVAQAQTLSTEVDVSALVELCERLKRRERKVSFEHLVLYLVVKVAQQKLAVQGDLSTGYVVPTSDEFKLATLDCPPGIRLMQLVQQMENLDGQAANGQSKAGKKPALGFTYLGNLGIDLFTPMIDLPQIPIVGVGRLRHNQAGESKAWFTLSYAGSTLSSRAAAGLLQQIVQTAEDPDLLF